MWQAVTRFILPQVLGELNLSSLKKITLLYLNLSNHVGFHKAGMGPFLRIELESQITEAVLVFSEAQKLLSVFRLVTALKTCITTAATSQPPKSYFLFYAAAN